MSVIMVVALTLARVRANSVGLELLETEGSTNFT